MAESRKVPRIDWAKYRGGRAAGRREAVDVLGDSLRELGCVRVQGHATAEPGGRGEPVLLAVALGVLEALADYFGLPASSLQSVAATELSALAGQDATLASPSLGPGGEVPGLLLLLPEVPAGLAVRAPGGAWWEASVHPGELLVVAGSAVSRVTAGRVAAPGLGWPAGGARGWLLGVASGREVEPLPAFQA